MLQGSLIAKRYAKALFDLALEMNVIEDVKNDMELVQSVCDSNSEFNRMLKSPVIRSDKKQKVIEGIFKGKISDLSLRYLSIITRKKREDMLKQIAGEYIIAYKKFKNIFTIHFESVVEISDVLRKQVIALLEERTKANIELNEEIKKELVGGFVLKYDDYKYDASIAYMLRRLKKEAAEVNLYKREL
jgi:F-type H+-transporting ATPase subunit delta